MQTPPYCPNPYCVHHSAQKNGNHWYIRSGFYQNSRRGFVQRFRCKACGKSFSSQTFDIDYALTYVLPYNFIFQAFNDRYSIRSIARILGVSPGTVHTRIQRLIQRLISGPIDSSLEPGINIGDKPPLRRKYSA